MKDNDSDMKNLTKYSYYEDVDTLFTIPKELPGSSWAGHVPFMFHLVKMLRPKRFVELGVFKGCSLLAACQALEEHKISCEVFGVDHWAGDPQVGFYNGDKVFDKLKIRARQYEFAKLLRMDFSEARSRFPDGSIDLLHIDGLHTYEAVYSDFHTYLPAMSKQGIVIMHDTHVNRAGYGVHQLWQEIKENYQTIEFHHSSGLGVVFVGDEIPKPIRNFLDLFQNDNVYRTFYTKILENLVPILPFRSLDYLNQNKQIVKQHDQLRSKIGQKDQQIAMLKQKIAQLEEELRSGKTISESDDS